MSDLDTGRKQEWEYYQDLYENHDYGRPSLRKRLTDKIIRSRMSGGKPKSWLDVGSGAFVVPVPSSVNRLVRTDPGHTEGDNVPMHKLVEGYGREQFDVVSSFDVLEHLLPEELETCVRNLWDVCKVGGRLLISVGTDVGGMWNGRTAHLTVQPTEWWQQFLADAWGVPARDVEHVATAKGTSPFFLTEKRAYEMLSEADK